MLKSKFSRTFTLIELLVVISIISILASLLLPALKNTRMSAKKVHCASNLKQQAIGLNMYSQDWSNYYPAPYFSAAPDVDGIWKYDDWQLAIAGYLYPNKDMRSARSQRPGTVYWCPEKVTPTLLSSRDPTIEADNAYRYGMASLLPISGNPNPKIISKIKNGSSTCLLTECYYSTPTRNGWAFTYYSGNVPHNRRANVLYADLHINDLAEKEFPASNSDPFWTGN